MAKIQVYGLYSHLLRDIMPSDPDKDIGVIVFSRDALCSFYKYYIICGHTLLGIDKPIAFPIDCSSENVVIFEKDFISFPNNLKSELVPYCNTNDKGHILSKPFIEMYLLGNWNAYNDEPFMKICDLILENEKQRTYLLSHKISIVFPQSYDELCLMTKYFSSFFDLDYYTPDYYEQYKYLIDALIHHYHVKMSSEEIILYATQICNIILRQMEERSSDI